LADRLCFVVAVQVLEDEALAAHGCTEGRGELERVLKGSQRFLVPSQINEGPRFANPRAGGLRIDAHEFIRGKEGLGPSAQFSEHGASALMGGDTVTIPLQGLFVGIERFPIAPRLAQHLCFFEQLFDGHFPPVNCAELWNANMR
jgi:hypothetical protein